MQDVLALVGIDIVLRSGMKYVLYNECSSMFGSFLSKFIPAQPVWKQQGYRSEIDYNRAVYHGSIHTLHSLMHQNYAELQILQAQCNDAVRQLQEEREEQERLKREYEEEGMK